MMKKTALIIYLISFVLFSYAQKPIRYSYNVNAGISSVARYIPVNYFDEQEYSHKGLFSYDFGINAEIKLSKNLFFESGIKYINFRGEDNFSYRLTSFAPFTVFDNIKVDNYTVLNLFYAGIPFKFKFKYSKFNFEIGAQYQRLVKGTMYHTHGEVDEEYKEYASSIGVICNEFKETIRLIRSTDIGAITSLSYDLSEKITVRTCFYIGIIRQDLKGEGGSPIARKLRQATIGLSYYL